MNDGRRCVVEHDRDVGADRDRPASSGSIVGKREEVVVVARLELRVSRGDERLGERGEVVHVGSRRVVYIGSTPSASRRVEDALHCHRARTPGLHHGLEPLERLPMHGSVHGIAAATHWS